MAPRVWFFFAVSHPGALRGWLSLGVDPKKKIIRRKSRIAKFVQGRLIPEGEVMHQGVQLQLAVGRRRTCYALCSWLLDQRQGLVPAVPLGL